MNRNGRSILRHALKEKLREALLSISPVAGIVLLLYLTPLVTLTVRELTVFLLSTLFLILGIALFNLGADLAMTPMGEHIGSGLIQSKQLRVLLTISFLMGVLITVAEPDLAVLAGQVRDVIDSRALTAAVGLGVGFFLLLAVLKIVLKIDLAPLLLFAYMVVFAFAALLLEKGNVSYLPMAFDSGGVTTGPITVPFIMALGVGIARSIGGRDAQENSFGLVAMSSIGPILAMLLLSLLARGSFTYEASSYSVEANLGRGLLRLVGRQSGEVLLALALILGFFLLLDLTILKLPRPRILQILIGIGYTFLGLVIFLTAATAGYMPIGWRIGADFAAHSPGVILFFSFILGMATVLAEPAIHVLNRQVEDVTGGNVRRRQMLLALSLGVGLSVCLSLFRAIHRFSLLYYLIPGYVVSLGLSFFVPKLYTAIAFDSGGVASGPLTSTFVLPLVIGVCGTLHGNDAILDYAFGIVAMVAMTPLIAIQLLGFSAIFRKRIRDRAAMRRIFRGEDAQIIYFEWEENE